MQEAADFLEECNALSTALLNATEKDLKQVTQFKNWTIEDVIGHLHIWNHATALTLENPEKFNEFFSYVATRMGAGEPHPVMQRHWFNEFQNGLAGYALLDAWRGFYPALAEKYATIDPNDRVAWVGPNMTARSKIIARQMETWAHGQEIFDVLGLDRKEEDRIHNIAHLGVTTYSWAFRNRGEVPPSPKPFIQLTAPSGVIWEWNDPQNNNTVKGSAVHFCQVVAQTRNVQDTQLEHIGSTASHWMEIAQCFAGLPSDPPLIGKRYKA